MFPTTGSDDAAQIGEFNRFHRPFFRGEQQIEQGFFMRLRLCRFVKEPDEELMRAVPLFFRRFVDFQDALFGQTKKRAQGVGPGRLGILG